VDGSGDLLNHIDYDSFGQIIAQSNAGAGDRFTYTGREFDFEINLYYYRARFYDPVLGRFINQDPLGFDAGDPNLYRYVFNSPLTTTDPSGLFGISYATFVTAATSLANAAAGFTIGYACGYLEGWYNQSPDPHREALIGAGFGTALGAVLSAVPAKYQLWVGIATGIAAAVDAARTGDIVIVGIRTTCIAVQFGASQAINRFVPRLLYNPKVRNFLVDELGGGPVPSSGGIFNEVFPTIEDAIGELNPLGKGSIVGREATKNPAVRGSGFTETIYVKDSGQTQWTVFHNPTTGQYGGAHPSSSNR
jgi:RHS repeat-associated protein